MKKILLITTGGTIASVRTLVGLTPEGENIEILKYVPEIKEMCDVDTISLFSLDSTNIYSYHYLKIARTIRENYDKYDGFVVCHGTDTMAYTASALSYLIQDSIKPIVLTGSQKPLNLDISDGKTNLIDSFVYVLSDNASGVAVVFNGNVILGTRARKTRTKSYNAFSSIDYPILGIVQDGVYYPYITFNKKETKFYDSMSDSVGLFKLIPGVSDDIFEYMMNKYDVVVVESFGVGGLPHYKGSKFYDLVQEYTSKGKMVVMTTQVQNEGSDIAIYEVGYSLKKNPNVLESYDMIEEATITKLMWILSITHDQKEIRKLFYTTISNDILLAK